jgi:hypothetical protein
MGISNRVRRGNLKGEICSDRHGHQTPKKHLSRTRSALLYLLLLIEHNTVEERQVLQKKCRNKLGSYEGGSEWNYHR